jgi:hypothetical protein
MSQASPFARWRSGDRSGAFQEVSSSTPYLFSQLLSVW